ncbi:delta-5 fatty acid desaturase [Microthyrium microscopicum]|uniref:Delta 8-(E)-sphingolipid desaturase n=1 Tax=Microthyrium microscopicum TaxID=703497 RepID=A0A6A6UHP8_9PEZI|nr:delta-5 fatty acid desaturase [Microthyrium microscopicum]
MHRASTLIQVVSEGDGHLQITKKSSNVAVKSTTTKSSQKSIRTITIEEVEAANTERKPWVAIRGKVYDLTNLLDKHPGGQEMLLLAAGRDATAMYESMHTDKNTKVLNKYVIGNLKKSNMPQFAERSQFSIEVEQRVLQYFKNKGIDPRHAPGMVIIYTFLGLVFAASFLGMFSERASQINFLLPWFSALVMGWCCAMMGFYHLHDGCHGAFSRNPTNWSILRRIYECLTGLSTTVWIYQHGFGHHPFTNVVGIDPDILSADPGIMRVHEDQPWWDFYGLQKYYWLPLYSQLVLSRKCFEWMDVFYYRAHKNIPINPPTWTEMAWGATTMSVYVAHHFILPLFVFKISIIRLILLHTISDLTWSLYLTLIFQASHVNDEVAWPKPNEDGLITADWAKLQVEASLDFAHDDAMTTFLCGSLNYQAVHHLFPYVCQWHYPAIAPIVKDACKKHGVRYNLKDSIWGMIGAHIKRINLFAEPPTLR